MLGDLDSHDRECRALANRDRCVVIAVHYRLAPEHPFPAAVEDAIAALAWVLRHPHEVGIDPSRVAVGGDSAGATLAAVATLWARDEGIPLTFQLLVYPAVDIGGDYSSYAENDGADSDAMDWLFEQYAGSEPDPDDWRLAPIRASSHARVAPAFVVTAELDPLRDEGDAYAAKLTAAGVPARTVRDDGVPHGFFSLAPFVPAAQAAIEAAGLALFEALHSPGAPPG